MSGRSVRSRSPEMSTSTFADRACVWRCVATGAASATILLRHSQIEGRIFGAANLRYSPTEGSAECA